MKKILYVAIAFMGIVGASFAYGSNRDLSSLKPMTIERAQFYQIKEKYSANNAEMRTQINFALYHNDSKNLAHWIEIKRTMSSKNSIDSTILRPLGLRELTINDQKFVIDEQNTTVTTKVGRRKVSEVIRIEIPREIFDTLGNESSYNFTLKADSFPEKRFTLSKQEIAHFTNGVQKIKNGRSDRD